MKPNKRLLLLLLTLMLVDALGAENSTGLEQDETHHKMSFAWIVNPILGMIGTLLNSFILYIFYSERQTFIKPVNVLIW